MPGKYSYGAVLAQRAGHGATMLPNDDLPEYYKDTPQHRSQSAAATRATSRLSVAGSHVTTSLTNASKRTSKPGQSSHAYNLTPAPSNVSKGRVFIVDSDSEDDVRYHPKPAVEMRPPRRMPAKPQQSKPRTGSSHWHAPSTAGSSHLSHARTRTISDPPKPQQQDPATPSRTNKKPGGVKAYMQARYVAEQMRSAGPLRDFDTEPGMSLADFLKSKPQKPVRQPEEKPLTVKQFLEAMPAPVDDETADAGLLSAKLGREPKFPSAEPRSAQQASHKVKVNKALPAAPEPAVTPRADPKSSVARQSSIKRANRVSRDGRESAVSRKTGGDDRSSHVDQGEVSQLVRPPPLRQQSWLQSSESLVEPTSTPSVTSRTVPPPRNRKNGSVSQVKRSSVDADSWHVSTARPSSYAPSRGHKVSDSMGTLSSLGSLGLDHLDIRNETMTTTATSRMTPDPKTPSSATNSNWPALHIESGHDDERELADMFNQARFQKHAPLPMSKDVDFDDEPTPRLQTLAEDVTSPIREFGTVSAGRDTTQRQRDSDEMSDISAVFPPDIGRYKYAGESGSPFEAVMHARNFSQASRGTGNGVTSSRQSPRKSGAILEKLKSKLGK